MKRALIFFLVACSVSVVADEPNVSSSPADVIHIATALDHLTVLEFGEPVTMAAAGSSAFQIERHQDKVFIKPLKTGASTNLFVWTGSHRFAYELEPPGEVKNMNFAVENVVVTPKPVQSNAAQLADVADMMLTRAFLGAERIAADNLNDEKGRVTVRIDQVFQSKSTLYIQYSISNHSTRPYRITSPAVSEVLSPQAPVSLLALQYKQLDGQMLRKLGTLSERPLLPVRVENNKPDLQPGEQTHGIVVIREQLPSAAIVRLLFGSEGPHQVQATAVL